MLNRFEWLYGVWFVQSSVDSTNWMAVVGIMNGKLTCYYRVHDPKLSWYDITPKGDTLDQMVKKMVLFANKASEIYKGTVDFTLLECKRGDPKIMIELLAKPWTKYNQGIIEDK